MPQLIKPQSIKIVVMGAAESGKTQLVRRLTQQGFKDEYNATIGIAIDYKTIDDNKTLQIWTIPEQSIANFYKDTELFIYCIDSSKTVNQEQIANDLSEAKRHSPNARLIVVATKSDILDSSSSSIPNSIHVGNQELTVIKTSAKNGEVKRLDSFLTHFYHGIELKLPDNYIIARKELVDTFGVLHISVKADLLDKLSSLDRKLANNDVLLADKISLLEKFSNQCEIAFKNRPSTLTRVLEIIAIIALPILVGVIGFGVGFALGLWTGPGAFLTGLAAGHAAAVAVTAVTGASTLASGGLAYGLFRPASTPVEIKNFDEVTRQDFNLVSAPAA